MLKKADHDDEPPCPYCCRPCVGPKDGWYHITHWHDPKEVSLAALPNTKSETSSTAGRGICTTGCGHDHSDCRVSDLGNHD
jgi:hypothetical protein